MDAGVAPVVKPQAIKFGPNKKTCMYDGDNYWDRVVGERLGWVCSRVV